MRPVGESLPIFPLRGSRLEWCADYQAVWFDSGTSALAVALNAVVRRSCVAEPKIIVPGYTCPDVISAVFWAGATPRVVDTAPSLPWYDVNLLEQALDLKVVAVVVPHFLGLRQPLAEIIKVCQRRGVQLVEDSAQAAPRPSENRSPSDLIIHSFGRGKPIPVGGGVLLCRGDIVGYVKTATADLDVCQVRDTFWRLRAVSHNLALSSPGYRFARRLPWLRVGETRFRSLETATRLIPAPLAERTLANWQVRSASVERSLQIMVSETVCEDLPSKVGWDGESPLLRYPILAPDKETRNLMFNSLDHRRLGSSILYGKDLAGLVGMRKLERTSRLEGARDFAERLLTLPTHSGVKSRHIAKLKEILLDAGGRGSSSRDACAGTMPTFARSRDIRQRS